MTFRTSGQTDIGCIRPQNEDSLLCDDENRLYAVADGIGGLPGGAQASQTAIKVLAEWFARQPKSTPPDFAAGLNAVNDAVHQLGRQISPRYGIGTTLTLAHFESGRMHVVHVGDTSLYRLRGGELETLTVEHNLENEMRARQARGETYFVPVESRAALTRCVGQPPPLEVDVSSSESRPGDRVLVCSDGITRYITPREIKRVLEESPDPAAVVRTLISRANERGGQDNSTGIAIFVE